MDKREIIERFRVNRSLPKMVRAKDGPWVLHDDCARLVERAFRDGVRYATICDVSDVDEAWRTSAVRRALSTKGEER